MAIGNGSRDAGDKSLHINNLALFVHFYIDVYRSKLTN